eukprot:PITA_14511
MDDFTPYGDAFETALINLEKVLERCVQTNVALSTEKCHMMMIEGIVLGHYIFVDGIKVDLAKIEVILRIPTPKIQKEVRSFLGHAREVSQYLSSKEKKKSIQQSATYTWIDGNLYHTGPNFQIRRCVREDKVFDILKACHQERCGGHFTDKRTGYKVL